MKVVLFRPDGIVAVAGALARLGSRPLRVTTMPLAPARSLLDTVTVTACPTPLVDRPTVELLERLLELPPVWTVKTNGKFAVCAHIGHVTARPARNGATERLNVMI